MVAPPACRPHPGLALAGALVCRAGWLYRSAAVKTRAPLTRTPGGRGQGYPRARRAARRTIVKFRTKPDGSGQRKDGV